MKTIQYLKILLAALSASLLISEAMAAVSADVIKSWQAKPRFVQIQKEASSLLQQSRGASPAQKAQLEDRARALLKELRVMGYAPAKKLTAASRTSQPASAKKGFGSMTPGTRSTAMRTPGAMPPGTKAKIAQTSPGTKPDVANSRMMAASSSPAGVTSKQLTPRPKATMPKATMPLPAEFAYKKMPVQPAIQASRRPTSPTSTRQMAAGMGQNAKKAPAASNGERDKSPKSGTQVAKVSPAMRPGPRTMMGKGAIFRINLTGPNKTLYTGDRVTLNAKVNNTGGAASKTTDGYELRCASNNCPFTAMRPGRINTAIKPGGSTSVPVIFNASKAGSFQLWVDTKYGKSNKISLMVKQKKSIRIVPGMRIK